MKKEFLDGFKKGLPIGIGYLAVSFAFGVFAVNNISPIAAIIMSFTNLTSSGQFAGVKMIGASTGSIISYIELGITVLLINLRYILMSISLSQKIDDGIPVWKRLIMGYGIADEIYAVVSTEKKKITAEYMFGITILPLIGWTLGTGLGAIGANIFPERLVQALNIALYAMFIAILIPGAKKSLPITVVILIAIAISCIFEFFPVINEISIGLKIIISTIIAALIGAILFPIKEKGKVEAK